MTVDGSVTGAIERGLVALVGTTHGDDLAIARDLARRVAGYRVFPDAQGKTNLSVRDIGGAVLVVSQFTLYANTKKGTRPSFTAAGEPSLASQLVDHFRAGLEDEGVTTQAGIFGAMMQLSLIHI